MFDNYFVDIFGKYLASINVKGREQKKCEKMQKSARGVKVMAEEKRPEWKTEWMEEGGKTSEVINHIHATIFFFQCIAMASYFRNIMT